MLGGYRLLLQLGAGRDGIAYRALAPETVAAMAVEAREKIDIRKEAKVVGDIRTARIVIEEGAYFKGSIDIVRAEAPKPAAQPVAAPKPQPVASAGPSSPAAAAGAGAGDIKR